MRRNNMKKKIELEHGKTGWVFHLINEIEEKMLDEYGMGWLEIEDNKLYFCYNDFDNVSDLLKEIVHPEPSIKESGTEVYYCSSWAPMTFGITWNPKEQVGYAYGDFKFKTVKDFRMFQMVFYKYKRQSKENLKEIDEWRKKPICWGDWQMIKIAEFALTYCDYTDEEREKIKKYYQFTN